MSNQLKYCDWKYLTQGGRNILQGVLRQWLDMLNNKTLHETDYHAFIAKHAGLFFHNPCLTIPISKLKLSSDFETDFVVIKLMSGTGGIVYEFIELESPHKMTYTKSGQPSATLTTAIQQIQNWREWLTQNRIMFSDKTAKFNKALLRDFNFRYTILIGRRKEIEPYADERNALAERLNVQIRSFDYLTDLLTLNFQVIDIPTRDFTFSQISPNNQLDNPFHKAISDSNWKKLNREIQSSNYEHFSDVILKYRKYNNLFDNFIAQYAREKNLFNG